MPPRQKQNALNGLKIRAFEDIKGVFSLLLRAFGFSLAAFENQNGAFRFSLGAFWFSLRAFENQNRAFGFSKAAKENPKALNENRKAPFTYPKALKENPNALFEFALALFEQTNAPFIKERRPPSSFETRRPRPAPRVPHLIVTDMRRKGRMRHALSLPLKL